MRLGARRPSGAWRALKSGLFGVAPGRTPPVGPGGLVLLGTAGRLSRLARFRSQGSDPHHHTVRRCMDPARPVEAVWPEAGGGYLRWSRVEHGRLINFGARKFEIKKYALSRIGEASRPGGLIGGTLSLFALGLLRLFAAISIPVSDALDSLSRLTALYCLMQR